MPLTLQAKLLRVLENREVFRIGSNEPIKVNVRLVSATFRDLPKAIAEGKFRQDLYHRLKVMTIQLPPLRERREDLPLLATHFIKEFNVQHGKHVTSIAEAGAQGDGRLRLAGQRPRAAQLHREHGRARYGWRAEPGRCAG